MNKKSGYFFTGLLATAFLASCGTNEPGTSADKTDSTAVGSQKDTITFTIETTDKETYCRETAPLNYCASTAVDGWVNTDSITDVTLLKAHANVVTRKGYDLEVVTKKGKQLIKGIVDRSGMREDVEMYFLHAVTPKMVAFKVFYYESYDYLVIDLETGEQFHTWGPPVPNQDGNMIIAGNSDLMASFTSNGLQLYVLAEGKWTLGMEKILDDWGPQDLYWLNNETVLSKKLILTQTDSGEVYKTEYVKILLKQEKFD